MVLYDPDAKEEYLLDGRYLIQPMKRGEWMIEEYPDGYYYSYCSVCDQWVPEEAFLKHWKYCPNCGAIMGSEE